MIKSLKLLTTMMLLAVLVGCSSGSTPNLNEEVVDEVSALQSPQISETEFRNGLVRVDSQYDEFDESTHFFVVTKLRDSVQMIVSAYLYDSGEVEAILSILYKDSDWIFFESMDIRTNGETITLFSDVASFDKFTNVDRGVEELYIHRIQDSQIALLMNLINDPEAKFRLLGRGGSVEREFAFDEIRAFKYVLAVYLGLKQGLKP